MVRLLSLVLLFLLNLEQAFAIIPLGRVLSHCTYLNDKLYCYGGSNENIYYSEVLSLHVRNESITHLETLKDSWQIVNPVPNYGSEGRIFAQVIASPDRTKMYIQGGGANEALFQNLFIVFDANTETWSTLPDFEQFGLEQSQIDSGNVNYSPYLDKLVFYGGVTSAYKNESVNVDGLIFNANNDYLDFGFHNITTFDMQTHEWTKITTAKNNDTIPFIVRSGSVSWSDSVIYLGGTGLGRNNLTDILILPFNYIRIYNFTTDLWHEANCTGEIPSARDYFTTTLLPDNETVLLFGGRNTDRTMLDNPCYILNLTTKVWSVCKSSDPSHTYDNRGCHSAVLVGYHLFIIFGYDNKALERNDIIILDVSDANNITTITNYAYKDGSTILNQPPILAPDELTGLGTGAIVGITVGCIALIAIILAILFFIRRNKQKSKEELPVGWDEDYQDNRNLPHEVLDLPLNKENSIFGTTVAADIVSKDTSVKDMKYDGIHPINSYDKSQSEQTHLTKPEQLSRIKPEELQTTKPEQLK